MATAPESPPKLFVSYSWSTPDHEARVIDIAKSLRESGIDVLLDKWNLRDGHDSIKFMESMITDSEVKKVVILADKVYMEKANAREGGVGTETQILTPDLYGGQNPDKFVLVVCERDDKGEAYVPTYYKGRIYIDFTREDKYADEFEKLIRWVFDAPLHVAPEVGKRPAFLDDHFRIDLGTGAEARRCLDAVRHGRSTALGSFTAYLNIFTENMEKFRIARSNDIIFDEQLVQSIDDFLPFKNELIEVLRSVAQYSPAGDFGAPFHQFLERMLDYTARPEHQNAMYRDDDWDNYKFFLYEVFLSSIAVFVRAERFDVVSMLLTRQYLLPKSVRASRDEPVAGFDRLGQYPQAFNARKNRLKSNRISLFADKLIERAEVCDIKTKDFCQADFLAFVRANLSGMRWYPHTWIYIGEHSGTLELFARAASAQYFNKVICPLLNITEKAPLVKFAESESRISSGYYSLDPGALMGIDRLATRA